MKKTTVMFLDYEKKYNYKIVGSKDSAGRRSTAPV